MIEKDLPEPGTKWIAGGGVWEVVSVDGAGVILRSGSSRRTVAAAAWPGSYVRVPGAGLVEAVLVGGDEGAWFEDMRERALRAGVLLTAHVSGRVRRSFTLPIRVEAVILLVTHVGHPAAGTAETLAARAGLPVLRVGAEGFERTLEEKVRALRRDAAANTPPTPLAPDPLELLDALGLPGWVDDPPGFRFELAVLRRALDTRASIGLTMEEAHLLAAELAARLRHLVDDEGDAGADEPSRLAAVRLLRRLASEGPRVHGLDPGERPLDLSWARDAWKLRQHLEDRVLRRLLGETYGTASPPDGWWSLGAEGAWEWRTSDLRSSPCPPRALPAPSQGHDPLLAGLLVGVATFLARS